MTVNGINKTQVFYPQDGDDTWRSVPSAALTVPSNVGGVVAATSVTFFWDAVEAATGYEYRVDAGSVQVVASGESVDVQGLTTDQQISFEVRAVNAAGESDWSTAINRTPVVSVAQVIQLTRTPLSNPTSGPGRVDFLKNHSERTSLGEHSVYVFRPFGTQGAVSVRVTSAGDAHDNIDTIISWTDGDASIHELKISVASKSPGDHRCYALLSNPTGGAVLHNDIYTKCLCVIEDGTVAPDSQAVFFDTTQGSNGGGTSSSPFNNIYDAVSNVGSKRYIYGRGSVTPDQSRYSYVPFNPSSPVTGSIPVPASRADESSRLYIRNWPGSELVIDGNDGSQQDVFGFFSTGVESFHTYRNIIFRNLVASNSPCAAIWYHSDGNHTQHTVENCTFNNIDGKVGTNNGGIVANLGAGWKIWGCDFSEIKTVGDNANGNTAGVYSYRTNHLSVQGCEFASTMSRGIYHKRTVVGSISFAVRFNIFNDCRAYYSVSGGGDPGHSGISFLYNVLKGAQAYFYHDSDTFNMQAGNAGNEIVGNIFIDCGADGVRVIQAQRLERFAIYDNIFINCTFMFTDSKDVIDDLPFLLDYNLRYSNTGNTSQGVIINLASIEYVQHNAADLIAAGVSGACANDTIANPLLTDAANDDFSFQAGSPALTSSMSGTPAVLFPETIGRQA